MSFRHAMVLSLFVLGISACTRDMKPFSRIQINAPSSSLGTMAALPVNQKACYGVNVVNPGFPVSPAYSCGPNLGFIGGFVGAGQSLSLDIPKGNNISINLYLYLMDVGDNGPCPSFNKNFSAADKARVYAVGSANNVTLARDIEVINITTNFPGLGQTIASQIPDCASASSNPPNRQVNVASGLATGAGYQVKGRIGRPVEGQNLSGGGYKLIVNQ